MYVESANLKDQADFGGKKGHSFVLFHTNKCQSQISKRC